MFKKILAFFAAMSIIAAFAAVDVNKATEAELDSIKHIGPATSKLIITERKKAEFKNWDDFITRVKGVGEKRAADFSASGLTVGGAAYTGPGAADAKAKAKADTKADAKKTDKPVAEKAKDSAKDGKMAAAPKSEAKTDAKGEMAKPAAAASAAKK
ncbi:competence protein ComEA [Polaromonas sp. OV174]|uniref:ComEA family DNA-binding protein n=1 Tax=Polaromonas sp. OV174 TaxID=1855300 RepID=UPI0008E5609F|nr:helix-hairpin-helix domain-containing protein [Polaromonas sp. OV174]SFB75182.1 competence protein ComEA [Polaromonas sp. OV174]